MACKGTPIEATTWKAGKSAFLFAQAKDGVWMLRFKLTASQAAAKKQDCEVGAGGWTKLVLAEDAAIPKGLAGWIDESYAAMAKPATKPKAARKATRK